MENSKILIIDDDARVARMLVRRLRRAGYTLELASDGKNGIEKSLALSPDMILLDIHMPIMDGYTVVKTLRELNYEGLVVACSASVTALDSTKTLDAGCDYFIPKPVGPDFEQTIQGLLRNR